MQLTQGDHSCTISIPFRSPIKIENHWWGYFLQPLNWVDILSFLLTLLVIVSTAFDLTWIELQELRYLAAAASFFLVLNLFDWLRLFEQTAFYVDLLS
jgi:hypothetical protein